MQAGRGGRREGSGRKPYPSIRPGEIVIDVRNARAYVSVWRNDKSAFFLEPAQNWEDLEDEASREIEQLGGHITLSGIYPCSESTKAQARFGRSDVRRQVNHDQRCL